jgi:arylsulfate sulfotransferase
MNYRTSDNLRRIPTIVLLLLAAGCSQPPAITSELDLTMNPSGHTPFAGLLTFSTDQPTRATLTITDGENTTTVTPNDALVTDHELMVLGLRPGRINTVEVSVANERGETGEPISTTVETPPVPDYYPPIEVTLSRPARMEPGYTLIPLVRGSEDALVDEEFGLVLAVDAQGEIVWSYEAPHIVDDPRLLENGNFLYQSFRNGYMVEADWLGHTINEWHTTGIPQDASPTSIPVETDTFHHDVFEMPSGNFLALSSEVRRFDDYATSEEDIDAPRAPANVIGDRLIEMQRDGTIVRDWRFMDLFDPYRLGYGSLETGFYEPIYGDVLDEPGKDWSHGNAVYYDPSDDTALVSFYHQSVVVKLDLASGELVWMLGNPEGWGERWQDLFLQPNGDMPWQYHQHAPKLTPAGTMLLFDNGKNRAFPPNPRALPPNAFSRAVEYRIDEAAGTVEEVWSYGDPDENWFFSGFISEADWLPNTENVLITVGGRVLAPDGSIGVEPWEGHLWATLTEVTHTEPAERVWEVVIDDPARGWIVYRSERVPSLYR